MRVAGNTHSRTQSRPLRYSLATSDTAYLTALAARSPGDHFRVEFEQRCRFVAVLARQPQPFLYRPPPPRSSTASVRLMIGTARLEIRSVGNGPLTAHGITYSSAPWCSEDWSGTIAPGDNRRRPRDGARGEPDRRGTLFRDHCVRARLLLQSVIDTTGVHAMSDAAPRRWQTQG